MFTENLDMIVPEWIEEVYTGHEEGCRCGCHGNYFKNGSRGFTRALNKAFKLNPEVVWCDNTADVSTAALETRKQVFTDGKARAFAYSQNGHVEWVDIVLDGNPLKTITFYTKK